MTKTVREQAILNAKEFSKHFNFQCRPTVNVQKISSTFLFLFFKSNVGFRAAIHKMVVRIANREDPDRTASSEAV